VSNSLRKDDVNKDLKGTGSSDSERFSSRYYRSKTYDEFNLSAFRKAKDILHARELIFLLFSISFVVHCSKDLIQTVFGRN
jgi:hypothetical protein